MSKKKAFSGSTMTLKDFHGGSIPSDLSLPSAPGVTARPADRAGFDRHAPWGNPMGRSDHRLMRPGSSPSAKNFDDKTPFLTNSTRIGRNFDEDERKPLDGSSAPRRTVSDDSIYAPANRVESKPDSYSVRKAEVTNVGVSSGQQGSKPGSPLSSASAGTYAGRASEATHAGVISQKLGLNSNSAVGGPHPNVWAVRKEIVSSTEPLPLASGPTAFSKLAHASALEKVSSGRWQSKQPIHHQAEVEVIHHSEMECGLPYKGTHTYLYIGMDRVIGREQLDETLAKHVDGGLAIEDGIHCRGKEFPGYERVRSPLHFEAKERNPSLSCDGVPLAGSDGKFDRSELQPLQNFEATERPKLKLIPRSKPFEGLEPSPVVDYNQSADIGRVEAAAKSHATIASTIQGLTDTESRNVLSERRKLNLKPRSQPLEKFEESILRDRNTLFGGARPRELVLKERGIDEVADDHVVDQVLNRVKYDVPKSEASSGRAVPAHHAEKAENLPHDHRIRKNNEKDHRVDVDRADMQRRNWRNENRRNSHESEKQQHQQQVQERDHSPDTWRRQPKPTSPDPSGVRYGKVASAVELAQAFSKSISDPKTADRVSGPRGLHSQSQVPFSRLVGQTSRNQINGY